MKKENNQNPVDYKKHGYPPYDDDKFYDVEAVASSNDSTGLIPTPPKSESEAESYSDLLNIPQAKGEVNNGFQHIRPQDVKNDSKKK